MHRVQLHYTLVQQRNDPTAPAAGEPRRTLHHPLLALLDAIDHTGSIAGAARHSGFSYRHVWGELKRWEGEFGRGLVVWAKGQAATLTPFGARLLSAERRAQAQHAPQIAALQAALEHALAAAFDDGASDHAA